MQIRKRAHQCSALSLNPCILIKPPPPTQLHVSYCPAFSPHRTLQRVEGGLNGVQTERCSTSASRVFSSYTHKQTQSLLAHTHCQWYFKNTKTCSFMLPSGQQPSAKCVSKCCQHRPTFVAISMSGHVNFLFLRRFRVHMLRVKLRRGPEETSREVCRHSDNILLKEHCWINLCCLKKSL